MCGQHDTLVVSRPKIRLGVDAGKRQGWLVVAVFLVAVVIDVVVFVYRARTGADVHSATIAFVLALAFLAAVLVTICWTTGERLRWRWGNQQTCANRVGIRGNMS